MLHSHPDTQAAPEGRLRTALFLTLLILGVELIAGYLANSLALLSDAGHILTDAFALGLAWFATWMSSLPPDERNTFGYQRSSILAALVNAAILILIAGFVGVEAFVRLRHPQPVSGGLVVIAAIAAILVNSYIAIALHREGDLNLNVRAALIHVLGDIAASAGVILSGLVIIAWHAYFADALLSFFIAALIGYGAWQIVRDTILILMEGTPTGVELQRLRSAMLEVPGVLDVHDLHVWSLSDGFRLLSAHVRVPDQSLADTVHLVTDVKAVLHRRFHIEHATIEVECLDCRVPQPRPIHLEEAGGATRERPA